MLLFARAFEDVSVLCLDIQVLVDPDAQVNLVVVLNLLTLVVITVVNEVIQLQEEFSEINQLH
jgi:hypothetical protein